MLPSRLVTVRAYGAPELSYEDKAKLDAAGLTSYLGGRYYRHQGTVELQVPEPELVRALAVLGIASEPVCTAPPVPKTLRCPECGSTNAKPLPPYSLYAMAAAFGLGFAVCLATRSPAGIAVLVPGWLLALRFSRDAGKVGCPACGHRWKPRIHGGRVSS